ncbi:MAG TPA: hypothetical protein VNA24_03605 [Hyalangium sp.]|nr:hypothetical protein [Hyalangium sp.]
MLTILSLLVLSTAPVSDSSAPRPADSPGTTQLVRVVARDDKSRLLGAYKVDDDWNSPQNNGCETSVEVRWRGKALRSEEKLLSKWTINMDKECAE